MSTKVNPNNDPYAEFLYKVKKLASSKKVKLPINSTLIQLFQMGFTPTEIVEMVPGVFEV